MNIERLIEFVRQNNILYDLSNPHYLNFKIENIIWDNIEKELQCDGSFSMKSHLGEDTDDENCDDPIRLFDNDINAVYFGSKLNGPGTGNTESRWTLELIANDEFCQPLQNFTLREPEDDLTHKLQGGTTSEFDISLLCVKLVDCGKFPWYFRKYTQQIMQNINSNEHSDNDHEIDVENVVDDSDDCFIVENLEHVTKEIIRNDQNCIKTVKPTGSPTKVKKCIDVKKRRRRDDKELQIALSKKNMFQVDFKRNQGLVGMKITRKMGPNTTPNIIDKHHLVGKENTIQKCVVVDENYLSAADKTLSSFGTQLIPITNEKESNTTQCKINNEKDIGGKPALVKSSSSQNVTVQFEISKISEKLINDLKTKKINKKSSEDKIVSKMPNESLKNNPENIASETKISSTLSITEKNTDSLTKVTSHVKNVKITNKYKNDQMKTKNCANHRSLIGLLVTNENKEDGSKKEIKCTKQKKRASKQSITTKLDKKPRKKIKKQKYEPKSPILHCSTIPKKPKKEVPKSNEEKTSSNLSKEPIEAKKIVDKLSNSNSCNVLHEVNQSKNVISKTSSVTKPHNVIDKPVLQNQSFIMSDKTINDISNIHAKPLIVSDKVSKNCNEGNKTYSETKNFQNPPTMPTSQNKTCEQTVLHEIRQDNVKEHTINAVPDTNLSFKALNKNYKPVISSSNVSTTTTIAPTIGPKPALSNQYANFHTYYGSHLPSFDILPRRMNGTISNNNIDVPIQNRYASAIILKSNNHPKLPFEKIREPSLQTMGSHPHRPMAIPSHTQQRFGDPPPPYPIFYPPTSSGNSEVYQSYFPYPANSVPNQFHPPHGSIAQQLNNPTQGFYRDCWLPHNLAPPPPPPPPAPPVSPTNIPPRNVLDMNKSKDCSNSNRPSASVMQTSKSINQNSISAPQIKNNNSSIIGINNDGLVKKINIVARPIKTKYNIKKGTVNVQQITNPQIMSRLEDTKIITTKTEMSKELDKLTFIDENINDFKEIYPAKIDSQNKKVAIMSKKPGKFETSNLIMNKKADPMYPKPAKGYSPPILPIPTYQKVLDKVASNSQIQNTIPNIALQTENLRSIVRIETKPMRKRDFVKCCKRKLNNAWNNDEEIRRREDAKKISLDEYKKRIIKNYKPEQNNKIWKEKNTTSGKRPNIDFKYRKNVDYNTETDLGYDSDSTVVL